MSQTMQMISSVQNTEFWMTVAPQLIWPDIGLESDWLYISDVVGISTVHCFTHNTVDFLELSTIEHNLSESDHSHHQLSNLKHGGLGMVSTSRAACLQGWCHCGGHVSQIFDIGFLSCLLGVRIFLNHTYWTINDLCKPSSAIDHVLPTHTARR